MHRAGVCPRRARPGCDVCFGPRGLALTVQIVALRWPSSDLPDESYVAIPVVGWRRRRCVKAIANRRAQRANAIRVISRRRWCGYAAAGRNDFHRIGAVRAPDRGLGS